MEADLLMGQHLPGMDRQQMEQINFPSVVADIPGYGGGGLFHEIVRAHLIGPLLAFIVALRGQHKDGHIPHIPHEAEQPQPVLIGESR